jgi:ribose transport system substrate-binding protein
MRCKLFLIVSLLFLVTTLTHADEKKVVVGFVQDTLANDWRLHQVMELKHALEDVPNIEFKYEGAKGDPALQILKTENMINRGVDILVSSPRDPAMMTPVLSRAYRKGIPVVLLTRSIDSQDYTSFITPDDEAIARQSARYLSRKLKGKGRVVMIRGVPTATTVKFRTEGFVGELKKYPGMKLVATIDGNYLRQDAIHAMEKLLDSGVRFDAIYSQSDSMAVGARLVMRKRGMNPSRFIIVGIDYISEAQEAIRKGEQSASITYPTCGRQAAEIIKRIIAGKKVARHIRVPSRLVTHNNVDKVTPIF